MLVPESQAKHLPELLRGISEDERRNMRARLLDIRHHFALIDVWDEVQRNRTCNVKGRLDAFELAMLEFVTKNGGSTPSTRREEEGWLG